MPKYLVVWRGDDVNLEEPERRNRIVDEVDEGDRDQAWREVEKREQDYANAYGEGKLYLIATGNGRNLKFGRRDTEGMEPGNNPDQHDTS